jgi:membrane protein YqaA with SNARE-associated domain
MNNHQREIAGIFVGASCLLLIWQHEYATAAGLLGGMMGFFIGEKNGEKKAKAEV